MCEGHCCLPVIVRLLAAKLHARKRLPAAFANSVVICVHIAVSRILPVNRKPRACDGRLRFAEVLVDYACSPPRDYSTIHRPKDNAVQPRSSCRYVRTLTSASCSMARCAFCSPGTRDLGRHLRTQEGGGKFNIDTKLKYTQPNLRTSIASLPESQALPAQSAHPSAS
jgi:hypothetical protein